MTVQKKNDNRIGADAYVKKRCIQITKTSLGLNARCTDVKETSIAFMRRFFCQVKNRQ